MPLSCRFYQEKYPEVEDVVMVNVRSIAEMGAYVHLLEYNNIEGMILLSELSRRRIRSINKLIRVGKTEPVVVIRVDKEKGYIDLSKRRVSGEDIDKCTERYAKAKAVNSILRHVAELLHYESSEQLEELYTRTAWHFEEKYKKKASAYDFFKQAAVDPSVLNECGLDEQTKEVLLSNIKRKLTSQAVKIRADIECACYGYEGIDAVKAALKSGLELSTVDLPIKINLIAPPLYGKCGLDEQTKEVLLSNIKRKLTSQAVKIRADIECACYGYEGIDAVKAALKSGLELSTVDLPIKINLIAPPLYGKCGLDEQTKEVLLSNIKRKLTSQAVKIRADIECACYGYEGIDAVKAALKSGLELSTVDLPIKINLIAPPLYGKCGLDEQTKEVLLSNIKRKLTSQAVKIRADIECACYGYEGIDAVKAALKSGLELSTVDLPIKINLIAPPLYGKCGLDEQTKEVLLSNIKRKLTSQAVKIRADIECACYGYEGIDAVKAALKSGLELSTVDLPIKINLIAPPLYGKCGLDEQTKEVLLSNIKRKLTSQAVKIRADIECACYGYEGIDAVKAALKSGLELSTVDLPIKINLIAPPLYGKCGLDEQTKEVLLSNIKRKLTSQAVKIRADIECACYGYEGIDAVKAALKSGLELSTVDLPIKINLIAPPLYGKCGLDEQTKEVLLSNIKRKLTSQAVKIRADIECACYGYEGIDAVKAALKSGLELSTVDLPIKINLIAPPLYGKCGLDEQTKEVLLSNIKRKLTSQAVKIRADIECACYGYEGIDAVKAALKSGLELSTVDLPIKINLIAPPLYGKCGLDEQTKEVLLSNIKRKLTSQAVKIRADIECACYGYEGIDAVKAALKSGLELSTVDLPIKINLIAPPLYGKCGLDEQTKEVLLSNIKRKLTSQAVKIRADIECACYGYEGIDAVKAALKSGLELSTVDLPIKINLIAPPLYVMTTSTPEKTDGLKALQDAIDRIQEVITGSGGVFNVQMAPKVVTATDEAELARQMERAEAENAEVAGDSAEEDEDNGMGDAGSDGETPQQNGARSDEDEEEEK